MCFPGYHNNGFVTTHALWYMMYGYTFTKQEVQYKWSQVVRDTQSPQISQKQDGGNIYAIMKIVYWY